MTPGILLTTLCVPRDETRVLLGMKKRGFGQGRWNGFGGKVKGGESIEASLAREMREEAGISPAKLSKQGIMRFHNAITDIIEVHVFSCSAFVGKPCETEEMAPQWFLFKDIPFEVMWPDDRHWMPLFLAGKKFTATFVFGKTTDILADFSITEVAELD